MKKENLTDILMSVARKAYQEGREHQYDDDFPDVGMSFTKKFEDTKIFGIIKNHGRTTKSNKGKG